MVAPIKSRSYLSAYFIVWAILAVAQFFILYLLYKVNPLAAAFDSFVSNALFSIFALSIWFVAKYNKVDAIKITPTIGSHLAAMSLILGIWLLLSKVLLLNIFTSDEYGVFWEESMVGRAVAGVLYYLIVALNFYVFVLYEGFKSKLKKESEMHDAVKDAELALLKSQFKPHFVFNSLNSISSLTISTPKKARDMIAKLSEYLRYTMQHDEESLSTWKEELSSVQSFLEIEQIRYGSRLEFSINGDPKCLSARIPTLLLQPVVENAIKYGVYESTEPVLVQLKGTCNQEMLAITVTNGYDLEAMPEKGNGIGLLNLKKRMALLYSRGDLVAIKDNGKEFSVELKIPQVHE